MFLPQLTKNAFLLYLMAAILISTTFGTLISPALTSQQYSGSFDNIVNFTDPISDGYFLSSITIFCNPNTIGVQTFQTNEINGNTWNNSVYSSDCNNSQICKIDLPPNKYITMVEFYFAENNDWSRWFLNDSSTITCCKTSEINGSQLLNTPANSRISGITVGYSISQWISGWQLIYQCNKYYFSNGVNCEPCFSGCPQCYGPLSDDCVLECINGNYLIPWLNSSQGCPANCLLYYARYVNPYCAICKDGYYLSALTCVQCTPELHCSICLNGIYCKTCESGQVLYSDKTCKLTPCKQFCAKCIDLNTCSNCLSGQMKNQPGDCVPCPQFCDYCTSENQCIICKKDYYLQDDGSCNIHKCADNCWYCKTAFACIKCESNYFLYPNATCFFTCDNGFFVESEGICSRCPNNCTTCVNSTSCDVCNTGFQLYINDSKCHNIQCDANCLDCYNSSNCVNCAFGYYNLNGNCHYCQHSNCENCFEGYYYQSINSTCLPCQNNCDACLNETYCQICNAISAFLNNSCYAICPDHYWNFQGNCTPCESYCKLCSQTSFNCTGCYDGYFLNRSDNFCYQCNIGCSNCTMEQCTSCNSGFGLYNGNCINPCPEFFYLDNSSNICKPCPYGYGFLNNSCWSKCPNGQYLALNTKCTKCIDFCDICDNGTQCNSCIANYQYLSIKNTCEQIQGHACLSNQYQDINVKSCIICQNNCVSCADNKTCNKCLRGYQITWQNEIENSCLKSYCLSNEYRISSNCYMCPINCKNCNSATLCTSCQIDSGIHKQNDSYFLCEPCNGNTTWINSYCMPKCNEKQQRNPTDNNCQNCTSPCLECTNDTSCTKCVENYYLNENKHCSPICTGTSFIQNISDISLCFKCIIGNCANCTSLTVCAGANNDSDSNLFTSFSNGILFAFINDPNSSLSANSLNFSQNAIPSLLQIFSNINANQSYQNNINNLLSNKIISEVLISAINQSQNLQLNGSLDDIIDNINTIKDLCEITKYEQLQNYSSTCIDLVNNIHNDKMTRNQTISILNLLGTIISPNQIKKNNFSKGNASSSFSSSQKTNLMNSLNSVINSLCIRDASNLTGMLYMDENTHIVLQNISKSNTTINHNSATISVYLSNISSINSIVYKSIEFSQDIEIIPKNNETFISSIFFSQILSQCSDSLENEEQPVQNIISANNSISVKFVIPNDIILNQPTVNGFYCGYQKYDSKNQENTNNNNIWENYGSPITESQNSGYTIICSQNSTEEGYFAVLWSNPATTSNKNQLTIIIACCCGVAVLIAGILIFVVWRCRKGHTVNISELNKNNSKSKNVENTLKKDKTKPEKNEIDSKNTKKTEKTKKSNKGYKLEKSSKIESMKNSMKKDSKVKKSTVLK